MKAKSTKPVKKSAQKSKGTYKTEWNLGLLYGSPKDPKIEKDMRAAEKAREDFAAKYDTKEKAWLTNEKALAEALSDFEKMDGVTFTPYLYFYYMRDLNGSDQQAASQIQLMTPRIAKAENKIRFFIISLSKIPEADQKRFLADAHLKRFRYFLKTVFDEGKHLLSPAEESIMALKSQPAHDMWIDHSEKVLYKRTIRWKGKVMPLPQAFSALHGQKSQADRRKMSALINAELKAGADFAEGEMNAILTNKKINDELRGYDTPYAATVRSYQNDPEVVKTLVDVVTRNFKVAERFYKVKAKMIGATKLYYSDRMAKIGEVGLKFGYPESMAKLLEVFGGVDKKFADMLARYAENGQHDVYPKVGKTGGAYCSSSYGNPTFVFLNHVDTFDSYRTLAHEMGHAFHSEFARSQGPMYCSCSYSLAETASTLFESIALDAIVDDLSDREKVIMLHNKINDDVSTIFRQIACFNYELDLHTSLRAKGSLSKEEMADMHNKHMQAYLGKLFELKQDDGYMFVQWSHLRRFFYVYSYAYGMLVSKAMLRRYKQDTSFLKNIETFLSAGGKDTPENILKEIGIDVTKASFWEEGIKEIEEDIAKLEKLVK